MADKNDIETAFEITQLFYQAVQNSELWARALEGMRQHIGASAIELYLTRSSAEKRVFECGASADDRHESTGASKSRIDEWFAYYGLTPERSTKLPQHGVISPKIIQLITAKNPKSFSSTQDAKAVAGPEGVDYACIYDFDFQDYDINVKFVLLRTKTEGDFTSQDFRKLDIYRPALMQSLLLLSAFNHAFKKQSIFQKLIDNTSFGILVVNKKGYLEVANKAAVKMVSVCNSFELTKSHHFVVKDARLKTQLKDCLDKITDGGQSKTTSKQSSSEFFVRVDKARSEGSFLLMISPVSKYEEVHVSFATSSESLAIIHIIDTESFGELEPGRLQRALGISAAEADVLKHFAEGSSPRVIAQNKGRSYHTIRNHLQKIMNKTNIHRQADLIRLIYAVMVVQDAR